MPAVGTPPAGTEASETARRLGHWYFAIDISDAAFSFARKTAEIAAEAAIDGIYVVRTNLPAEICDDATTVRSYKSLALVERAFRCLKTVDLQIRPIYHWLADRVRAHVLLCMLAYYLEWHMRQSLAPMLVARDQLVKREHLPLPLVMSGSAGASLSRQRSMIVCWR